MLIEIQTPLSEREHHHAKIRKLRLEGWTVKTAIVKDGSIITVLTDPSGCLPLPRRDGETVVRHFYDNALGEHRVPNRSGKDRMAPRRDVRRGLSGGI